VTWEVEGSLAWIKNRNILLSEKKKSLSWQASQSSFYLKTVCVAFKHCSVNMDILPTKGERLFYHIASRKESSFSGC